MTTHIVPGHAPMLGRGPNYRPHFRALCNALVEDIQHVAANPTCQACRERDEDEARQLEALIDMPPAEKPVRSTYSNPLKGYRPRR